MDQSVSIASHNAFAVGAQYTAPTADAKPVSVRVVVDIGIEQIDEYGTLIGTADFVDFRLDLIKPEPGGLLSDVRGRPGTWKLLRRMEDDGIIVRYHMEPV